MNNTGEYGAATNNIDSFPFVVGSQEGVGVLIARYKDGQITTEEQ